MHGCCNVRLTCTHCSFEVCTHAACTHVRMQHVHWAWITGWCHNETYLYTLLLHPCTYTACTLHIYSMYTFTTCTYYKCALLYCKSICIQNKTIWSAGNEAAKIIKFSDEDFRRHLETSHASCNLGHSEGASSEAPYPQLPFLPTVKDPYKLGAEILWTHVCAPFQWHLLLSCSAHVWCHSCEFYIH